MTQEIIDCCSLINLYTGWGSLDQLRSLGFSLHIAKAVLDESVYVNESGPDGGKVRVKLDLHSVQRNLAYKIVIPETPEELNDYIEFATEVDDGEAQSLAVAKHRNLILLTDDRKALAVASRPDVGVKTYTTAHVLQMWSALTQQNAQQLPSILKRISSLARFTPSRTSADRVWWDTHIT